MAKQSYKLALIFLMTVSVVSYSFAQQTSDTQSVSQVTSLPPTSTTPPPLSQVTSLPPTSTTPPPLARSNSNPQSSKFNEWLQTNGYADVKTTSVTTTTSSSPPKLNTSALTFEESQKVMLDSAPDAKFKPDADSIAAFNAMLRQNMPLAPRQVVELHQQIDVAQRAAAIPANIPPKPVSTTLMINLAPGTTPPAVRLAQGYVTSLVFVDSTGSPWPIAAYDIGNPKAVNIQWDSKSNILIIQAVAPYSDGDIVVRLVGLPTPVTLELVSGQRVVDYRVDIHVSGIGPNTKDVPIGIPLPNSANQLLLGVLDGVAPAGSKTLNVVGADCDAWLLGEKIYLRTRLTVLSPGWVGKMSSPDGMQAYELPKTSSVLISRFGEPAELKIEGF
jgi:intracellular multiplication protein IcmK